MDCLSRRVHFIPSRFSDNALQLALSFFKNIMPHHGFSDSIISDRNPLFMSRFWTELFLTIWGQLKTSSARHPQTDGVSEVMNQAVKNFFCFYCEYKQRNWNILLPAAGFAYNSSITENLAASPFEIDLYGAPKILWIYYPAEKLMLNQLMTSKLNCKAFLKMPGILMNWKNFVSARRLPSIARFQIINLDNAYGYPTNYGRTLSARVDRPQNYPQDGLGHLS